MQTLIIATTCINRLELHNDIFPDWINWINKLNKEKYNIMWYIHIDTISSLKYKFSQIKENLENLINNKFKVLFIKGTPDKGNFLNACKKLSTTIYNYAELLPNKECIKVFWLEDDWKLNNKTCININDLIEKCSSKYSLINLTFIRNNYIHALAPSISSFLLWSELFYKAWTQQKEHIDPEHCVGLYYLNNYGPYDKINNCTIINKNIGDKILNFNFMNYENSKYTIWNNKYKIKETDKYISKDNLLDYYDDDMVMFRITPGFCIDGCKYGRNFMEKLNLEKTRVQTGESREFYKTFNEEKTFYKNGENLDNDLSFYKDSTEE